jgi:ANTAR domain
MTGTTLRIENSSRTHAESLCARLSQYGGNLVQDDGSWQVEVQLGEPGALLLGLFDTLGSWLEGEAVDSLLLHLDERRYTLLRPSTDRPANSPAFLLERVAQLETALASRVVIEQAKGVVARALGISIGDAFVLLRRVARSRRTSFRELAARIASAPDEAEAILAQPAKR